MRKKRKLLKAETEKQWRDRTAIPFALETVRDRVIAEAVESAASLVKLHEILRRPDYHISNNVPPVYTVLRETMASLVYCLNDTLDETDRLTKEIEK